MNRLKKHLIITIDGPAASGKGSLARKLANKLGYSFLDTGALYRRVALKVIEGKQDPHDTLNVIKTAQSLRETLGESYNDSDLRNDKVGNTASIIAQIPEVRQVLVEFQRHFASKSPVGAVLDGRDIGTVICPDADIKLFITASPEKRAERRHKELQSRGIAAMKTAVLAEMQERDERDAVRLNVHLAPDHKVNIIDTSNMTPQEVMDETMKIINACSC